MEEASMSMNHVLSAHLLDSFEQSRRASTPPFGGHGLTGHGPSTQLGFSPMLHGNYSQMSNAGNSSLSMEQLAQMQAKLNKKLGPEFISQRPGPGGGEYSNSSTLFIPLRSVLGVKLTYAEGWKIINLANEVFGFNGWSSSVLSITTEYIDQNPETQRYNVGVSAVVRVTLRDGAFHEDVGFGALDNSKGKGAALDKVSIPISLPAIIQTNLILKCKKEAVTDAIKRTLRNFGNVLGNCLYDKQYVSEIAKIKAPVVKLDKDTLHRRPDLAGPVPNIPPRESTLQPTAPSPRNPPTARPPGNPSPLATSTPITNRTIGGQLPTPDTSLVAPAAPAIQPVLQTNTSLNTNQRPSGNANSAATSPVARPSGTSNVNARVTSPAPGANPEVRAPQAPVERTSSDPALFDAELAGELLMDTSVYGGSEDDAFFDNILPGELDIEVTDVPTIPPRVTPPQNPKSDFRNSPTAQAGASDVSNPASSSTITAPRPAPATASNGNPDESGSKRPRIRLADAIRGGAPGAGGSGPVVGQKRQRTS
ncbi:unnamed protein product [Rhizoctonia solani]|uniref:Uncharacterized protein n=1 Tax=Rhizoctonia solani TaxID=456999 RepID=A0A8H3BXV0_9AGAM|nr:unnamed protein product [Rhizoctonia solani]